MCSTNGSGHALCTTEWSARLSRSSGCYRPPKLTVKGARPQGDWAGLWAQFYHHTPLEAYNRAEVMGQGSKSYVLRKYIDRGYVVFHFSDEDGRCTRPRSRG